MIDNPIFNSLIQDLFALTKEHYRTINFVNMQKYKPILPSSTLVEILLEPARHKCVKPRLRFAATRRAVQSSRTIPLTNRPVLDYHIALGSLLDRYLEGPRVGKAQVPNQFKALPNWTLNVGAKNIIGVDTFRVRSW